jgi:threonine/homoserine/homoserine lactone efflux protein
VSAAPATLPVVPAQPPARVLRDGALVGLLNPKTTLFFAAFLPQFTTPAAASPLVQTLVLGSVFVGIAACTDALYVLLATHIAPRVAASRGARRWGQRLGAAAFIGLGVLAAASERPIPR